jgi:hypothetical protein
MHVAACCLDIIAENYKRVIEEVLKVQAILYAPYYG